jgi:hypothetical protein
MQNPLTRPVETPASSKYCCQVSDGDIPQETVPNPQLLRRLFDRADKNTSGYIDGLEYTLFLDKVTKYIQSWSSLGYLSSPPVAKGLGFWCRNLYRFFVCAGYGEYDLTHPAQHFVPYRSVSSKFLN